MTDSKSQFFDDIKDDFKSLGKRVNKMFEDLVGGDGKKDFTPAVDIFETRDSFIVMVELAGIEKKDVKLQIKDNHLHIKGTRTRPEGLEDVNFFKKEIKLGEFSRSFSIPEGVGLEHIQAGYTQGMLKISFPKDLPEPEPEVEEEATNINID